jgi:hypothetical protein
MRTCRALALGWLLLLSTGAAWSAPLRVQQATLYVEAPAEILSTVASGRTAFTLPSSLVPGSLLATQRGAPLSVLLRPVYASATAHGGREARGYQARLRGARPGVQVEVRYRVEDTTWTPVMSLRFAKGRAQLQAQARVTSASLDLTGAKLRLMSGRVARGYEAADPQEEGGDAYDEEMGAHDGPRGELQLAARLTAAKLRAGSTLQVPLVSLEAGAARTGYWDSHPPQPDGDEPSVPERARVVYTFRNTTKQALPEGEVTVGEAGGPIGKGHLAWTPPGQMAALTVSNVSGLRVGRRDESEPLPATWEMRHRTVLEVRSALAEPLSVEVDEHLEGYLEEDNASAFEFSLEPGVGTRPGILAWKLSVPAQGRAEVSYRYHRQVDIHPLDFLKIQPDDSPDERQYLFQESKTFIKKVGEQPLRIIGSAGFAIYRLPIPEAIPRADLCVNVGNSFRLSLAPEANGGPGEFTRVADAAAISGKPFNDASNYTGYLFDLRPYLQHSRNVYLRVEAPEGGETFIAWISAFRTPEGFPSRGRTYPVNPAPSSAQP